MVVHAGNAINQITFEEHDGLNNAKRVNVVAGGVGQATVTMVGLVTVTPVGLFTLASSPNFIGLVSVIGKVTPHDGTNPLYKAAAALADGTANPTIGGIQTFPMLLNSSGTWDRSVNAVQAYATFGAGIQAIGQMVEDPSDFKYYTVYGKQPNTDAISTTAGYGAFNVAFGHLYNGSTWDRVRGDTNGLYTKNAGTTKTLISLPILLSTNSAATVYVPTNNFYITSFLLNSNATVRVNIRSGATYLTGNASLGINLNPGSGFVLPGSPDSPWYKSLSTQAPIVIEKADSSGVIAQIGGSVTFFDAI